jgi:uncharacterized protein YegL
MFVIIVKFQIQKWNLHTWINLKKCDFEKIELYCQNANYLFSSFYFLISRFAQRYKMSISVSASVYPFFSSVDPSTKPIVAVKITPAPMRLGTRRPFHLAMLLDVSGSMDGERIHALRRTLNLLVDALCENDILTLITYNNIANVRADCIVIAPDTRITLHTTVESLIADGGTNMEAAISALLTLAADPAKPNVDAVFILTDGHINGGMTSSAGLLRLLQNQMNQGVPINTLGYGADHNSRLLRDMALRSNGSYTFADAAEVLPAIIGDIMGGLEAEVGRQAKLAIPDGWNCLELQTIDGGVCTIGTLIAEKPQWVVLEGEAGTTSIPRLVFTWQDQSGNMNTENIEVGMDISMLEIVEQRERCRVATCFAAVTEDVEGYRIDDARTKLGDLAKELAASPAKDTSFVIRLQAQVDDMLDSLKPVEMPPAVPGGLARSPAAAAGWFGGGGGFAPSVAPVVSRLASNTTVLVNQRGIMSSGSSSGVAAGAPSVGGAGTPYPLPPSLFSSPSQRTASNRLASAYSEQSAVAPSAPTLASASTIGPDTVPEGNGESDSSDST